MRIKGGVDMASAPVPMVLSNNANFDRSYSRAADPSYSNQVTRGSETIEKKLRKCRKTYKNLRNIASYPPGSPRSYI